MKKCILDDILDCNVPIRIQPVGLSMHPFIRRGDYITITPLAFDDQDGSKNTITTGDCVIFREGSERWLIHRVMGIDRTNGRIITKGDALLHPDLSITRAMIWGKVSIIHRADSKKEYPLDRPLNRLISRLIALLARGEAVISYIFRLRRRQVEFSSGFEFTTRIIKFPKWILTRAFFP
jgi:hypothetical protein